MQSDFESRVLLSLSLTEIDVLFGGCEGGGGGGGGWRGLSKVRLCATGLIVCYAIRLRVRSRNSRNCMLACCIDVAPRLTPACVIMLVPCVHRKGRSPGMCSVELSCSAA